MTKDEVIAALRKVIPGNADYGEINEIRVEHYNNEVIKRLVNIILEPEYDRFRLNLANNIKLGREEW